MSSRITAAVVTSALLSCSPAAAQQGAPDGQWPAYGGDHGSTKYSPLDEIDSYNVERLRVAWRWASPDNPIVTANRRTLPALPDAFKSTPVLVDGVLYIKTSLSQAAAIDAATGETLWTFDPGSWEGERPANTGFNSRGVAYWSDGRDARILLPTGNAYLWALDARTGRPIADFGADGAIDATQGLRRPIPRRDYQLMSVPIVVGDVVVLGSVVFDGPRFQLDAPGDVRGFDVRTGEELWEFHTIPQPGEFGNETWENGSWESSGATNAWGMLTADPELGYVYLPIGTPTNDYYGGHRLGDNLFAESIVCVDAATGERVWHFQFVHHGLWDYDATAAPVLVDLVVDGRPIEAVAVVTKQAYTYVFDRVTGEPVWPIEERPVRQTTVPGERTSPTQPHPTKPPPFDRQGVSIDSLIDFTELRAEAVEIRVHLRAAVRAITAESEDGKRGTSPAIGGANWHGAAVDPETGWLYVPSRTQPRGAARPPEHFDRTGSGGLRGPRGLALEAALRPPQRLRPERRDARLDGAPRRRTAAGGHRPGGSIDSGSTARRRLLYRLLTKSLLFLGFRGRQPGPRLHQATPRRQTVDNADPTGETIRARRGAHRHADDLPAGRPAVPTGRPTTRGLAHGIPCSQLTVPVRSSRARQSGIRRSSKRPLFATASSHRGVAAPASPRHDPHARSTNPPSAAPTGTAPRPSIIPKPPLFLRVRCTSPHPCTQPSEEGAPTPPAVVR